MNNILSGIVIVFGIILLGCQTAVNVVIEETSETKTVSQTTGNLVHIKSVITEIPNDKQDVWNNLEEGHEALLINLKTSREKVQKGETALIQASATNRSDSSISVKMILQIGGGLNISQAVGCAGNPCVGDFPDIPGGKQRHMNVTVQRSSGVGSEIILEYDYQDPQSNEKKYGQVKGFIGLKEKMVKIRPPTPILRAANPIPDRSTSPAVVPTTRSSKSRQQPDKAQAPTNTPYPPPSTSLSDFNRPIRAVGKMHEGRSWEYLLPHLKGVVRLNNSNVLVTGGTCDRPNTSSAEIFDRESELWFLAACLNDGRRRHTTTLLADGRVLVTGGEGTIGPPTCLKIYSVVEKGRPEILDLSTGKVPMQQMQCGTSVPTFFDQRNNSYYSQLQSTANRKQSNYDQLDRNFESRKDWGLGTLDTAEIYDPKLDQWDKVGNMNVPRENHTATLLQNGQVLIVGGSFEDAKWGWDKASESAEIFDPDTGQFYPKGNITGPVTTSGMSYRRTFHSAELMSDGRVILVGGTTGAGFTIYDPVKDEFFSFESGPPAFYAIPLDLGDGYAGSISNESGGGIYDVELGMYVGGGPGCHRTGRSPTVIRLGPKEFRIVAEPLIVHHQLYDPEGIDGSHCMSKDRVWEWGQQRVFSHLEDQIAQGVITMQGFAAIDLGSSEILIVGGSSPPIHDPRSAFIIRVNDCRMETTTNPGDTTGTREIVCANHR